MDENKNLVTTNAAYALQKVEKMRAVTKQILADSELRKTETWWQNLSPQWKEILAINVAFEENGIDYEYIHEKEWNDFIHKKGRNGCIGCYAIYEMAFGKAFEMHENLDLLKVKNLTFVWCQSEKLSDIEPLRNLPNLQTLDCSNNQLRSLAGLENLINLQSLWCYDNQLSSLEGLENLCNLQTLWCSKNQLRSLEGLENLSNLQSLYCSNNQISSLEGLENLINLQSLDCRENLFSEEEIEEFKQAQPNCQVIGYW